MTAPNPLEEARAMPRGQIALPEGTHQGQSGGVSDHGARAATRADSQGWASREVRGDCSPGTTPVSLGRLVCPTRRSPTASRACGATRGANMARFARLLGALRAGGGLVALVALGLAGGCAPGEEALTSASAPQVSGVATQDSRAVLDWTTATVTLPLDRYGMTPQEAQIVFTAAAVKGYLCQTGETSLDPALVEQAKAYLRTAPRAVHWLWGRWDAQYVAAHGLFDEDTPPFSFAGDPLPQGDPCRAVVAGAGLEVIATAGLYPPTGPDFGAPSHLALQGAALDIGDAARGDPASVALMAERGACIERAGYTVEAPADGGGAHWVDSWTDEQRLRASLAEAQCDDDMGYTQRVGDIVAAYQVEYIAAHEAELSAIKAEADANVARARELLRDVGIQ